MKLYLIIFAIVLTGTAAKAQSSFKTNESISSQLRNGTAPGLLYSNAASVKKATAALANAKGPGNHIVNNTLPGAISDKKMAGTKPQTDLSAQTRSAVPLASDRPAEKFVPVEKVEPPKIVQ